jgi:anti-sigma regulatory factor (Ser/Thr protein kinase)
LYLVPGARGEHTSGVDFRVSECAEYAVPRTIDGVALAREFTRVTLGRLPALEDALLVVTELVTNAVLHGRGVPVLRLRTGAARLRIEVSDESPRPPKRRTSGADGGWGLALVDRLAADWGVVRAGRGKVVWCELPV